MYALDPDNPDDQAALEAFAQQPTRMSTGPHRARVTEFFRSRGNHPATNIEIREAVKLGRGAVAVVLYQKDSPFEKMPRTALGKFPWRLKPEAYRELMEKEQPRLFPEDEEGK